MKKSVTRLYESLKPSNYSLNLDLDPDKKTFSGAVTIKALKTGRPSQRITLHQKDLKITGAELVRHDKKGDESMPVDRINSHAAFDELRLHSSKKLFPGEYTITVHFNGKITDPMNGLYPCYFRHESKDKLLLATQFESHHAREVFPCIDEPEAKATFDLTLITPDEGNVLANTPIKNQERVKENNNSTLATTFETTPVMSTYLLAFAYGDVGFKEAKTKRGTLVRCYATPKNVQYTDFALDTAVKCLEFYEEYFDIPYPLPKLDMIALPDFASGAMENWGLVTYREQTLLVDPKNTSLITKQYVAMVIAHELAHQWFGNLVTMRWWTDLWLNEGFASWIEYLACDKLFPDWQMWTQFIVNEQQSALKLDSLDNTHPIEVPINHPDEIRSIFDAISYNKGASVIHMLHGYLGPEDFREGLRHYLKENKYGNAETSDLWKALEKSSGKPVSKFMHAWTSSPGFPLVSVSQKPVTSHQSTVDSKVKKLETEDRRLETSLHQERFYMQKPDKLTTNHWPVPVLGPIGSPDSFDSVRAEFKTESLSKINVGQSGFYRTVYDKTYVQELSQQMGHLGPLDRLGLLSDAFETAKAGYASVLDALTLLEHAQDEDNSVVWDIIASNITELRRVMDDENVREALKPVVRKLAGKQLNRLGWQEKPDDSYFDKLLRPTILGLQSVSEEPAVVEEAIRRFDAAKSPEDIPADLRSIVFNTAARHGNQKTFDKLLKFHNATDNSEERVTLASALTGFEQLTLIKKALSLISTKDVRRQDAMYWLAYSFMNRHAKKAAWEWMQHNWAWLEKELGSDLSFFRTPIYAARSFSDKKFLSEYEKFFKPKMAPGLERSIKQGQEMLEWQIAWKDRDLQAIKEYLT